MATPQELSDLIKIVKQIGDASFNKRMELFSDTPPKIASVFWELNDETEMFNYVQTVATSAKLSITEKNVVVQDIKDLLSKSKSVKPNVHELELKLIALRAELNNARVDAIIRDIDDYKTKIQGATQDLEAALKKIQDLDKGFGAIAIAVSLVAAMVSVATGKFDRLAQLISHL